MWRRVRMIFVVALITGLIWLFAEAESLRTQDQQVELVVEPQESGTRTLEFVEPGREGQPRRWTVTLEGPTGAVDDFIRALRKPVRIYPGLEGVPRDSGESDADLKTILLSHPDLNASRRGVSITRVEPPTVKLRIEDMATITLKVEVRVPPRGELDGPPEAKPPTVSVTLPKSEADKLTPTSVAIATIDQTSYDRLVPGRKETVPGVPVRLPPDVSALRATIDPPAVDVTLTVRRGTVSVKVASAPVHVRLALTEYGKWDVSVAEPFLTDVTVTGPREIIKQIEDKTLPLIAYVPLSYEELERGITSKEAVFSDLPPELYPLKFEAANRTVTLSIKKREAPPNGGATPETPRTRGP